MSDKQTFLKDKPYKFVPLIEKCVKYHSVNQGAIGKYTYSGKLKVQLEVCSLLHVGTGKVEKDKYGDSLHPFVRRNGRIIIPGSSLKGAVRSVAEAVSYSCGVRLPDYKSKLESALPQNNRKSCSDTRELCPTCSIFGMVNGKYGYKGKVSFGELDLIKGDIIFEKLPAMNSPFKNYPTKTDLKVSGRYGNERLYYCRACEGDCSNCSKENYFINRRIAGENRKLRFRGRKFYRAGGYPVNSPERIGIKKDSYEMLNRGALFEGDIVFQNMSEAELKLLAYALGLDHHFTMKFGYGKPLGYGNVKISLLYVEDMGVRYGQKAKISAEKIQKWACNYSKECSEDLRSAIQVLEDNN